MFVDSFHMLIVIQKKNLLELLIELNAMYKMFYVREVRKKVGIWIYLKLSGILINMSMVVTKRTSY